ncbi:hypothetical protein COU78_06230 [Candidatus Peregrinibacteria bacterium CG10_big_fil_rev_8_21_14_0_10_49_24]|nr:MAG: hypothetical protein COV83_03065 [Candidatus Peregrinibacteria bacterium CG11_big_fil_rev_8_21_14_0_20_49_14]PIR50451.1 MAG: hypothetical protein COU78_06230 [Candidatus Peregrinibacteria bacterium CG10_big_fil_rev_8_21_14_0_10_49_24]PJA68287.1 MAG: hypothetical protein CO157_00220 [Candidatus Peregrinibacteria bacterium CG_4_9_14_3_um_filter_49_12]
MKQHSQKPGYIFLLSVLVVGAVAVAITTSVLLLSTSAARTGLSLEQSGEALAYAQACADHALLLLRADNTYAGREQMAVGSGTCEILSVGGIGNENRTLCTEGVRGDTARRIEILIERILPSVTISTWQEVSSFVSCSY